jgi:hypothetical protein
MAAHAVASIADEAVALRLKQLRPYLTALVKVLGEVGHSLMARGPLNAYLLYDI